MKIITACMIASLVVASQLFAQGSSDLPKAYDAETMLNLCRGEVSDMPPEMQSMTCTFRLQGVGDMMSFNCLSREAGFEPAPAFSAQISASRGAVRQTFINFMEANPEVWGSYWAEAVALALSESFPCES